MLMRKLTTFGSGRKIWIGARQTDESQIDDSSDAHRLPRPAGRKCPYARRPDLARAGRLGRDTSGRRGAEPPPQGGGAELDRPGTQGAQNVFPWDLGRGSHSRVDQGRPGTGATDAGVRP